MKITEKNFLGKGINLDSNLEISEQSLKGKFIYSKPNFNYTDNTLFTSLNSTETDNLTTSGYKVSKLGFSIGTKFEQYENFYFSSEIDFSLEDLETNDSASSSLKNQEGNYNDLYFNYSLDLDTRNSSYNPSSGNRFSFYSILKCNEYLLLFVIPNCHKSIIDTILPSCLNKSPTGIVFF